MFEGCGHQCIGSQLNDALHIGLHAVAQIGNAPLPHTFLDKRQMNVFQFAYPAYTFLAIQFLYQCTVYAREDGRPLQRCRDARDTLPRCW